MGSSILPQYHIIWDLLVANEECLCESQPSPQYRSAPQKYSFSLTLIFAFLFIYLLFGRWENVGRGKKESRLKPKEPAIKEKPRLKLLWELWFHIILFLSNQTEAYVRFLVVIDCLFLFDHHGQDIYMELRDVIFWICLCMEFIVFARALWMRIYLGICFC